MAKLRLTWKSPSNVEYPFFFFQVKHCFLDLPTNLFYFSLHIFLTTLSSTNLHTDKQNSSCNMILMHLSSLRLLSGIQKKKKRPIILFLMD